MAKKAFEVLSETMFYVIMSFLNQEMCGIDCANFIEEKTNGRVKIGPGTLYTILSKFEEEKLIAETAVEGRKRRYKITQSGVDLYKEEVARLRLCILDAESEYSI